MDSGVYVLAAANGRVTFTVDTIFDREKTSIISKGLGNYICIKHPNKYYTYYAHLKKYSLLVQEGDSVFAGQRIAQVASSGNSTDPHLHFELWFDSSYVVDPFKGSCGNPNSLWLETPHYDSNFTVWEHGLHGDTLNIDILRERFIYHPTDSVYWNNKAEGYISLWSLMRGVRKGDSLTVKWFTEATGLVEQYTFYIERDYWYYYFWTHSALFKGEPLSAYQYVTLERNGTEVIRDSFASLIDNVSKINKGNRCKEILTSLKKSELNLII